MAFVRTSEGHRHVFIARADGSSPTQITDGASNDESPTFSPEGDRVAYCSIPADGTAGEANLFTVHTDGSGLVQLTEGDRRVCHPSWGRDGFIYFDANVGHRFHIWRLRPGTA
jgi:TolB protein